MEEVVAEITSQGWTVGKVLGQGAFGKVVLVEKDSLSVACKIVKKVCIFVAHPTAPGHDSLSCRTGGCTLLMIRAASMKYAGCFPLRSFISRLPCRLVRVVAL